MATCVNDLRPRADAEEDGMDSKRHPRPLTDRRKCWAWCYFPPSSNLAHLSMCHLSQSLSLSSSLSPFFTGSASAQERLSMAQTNRSSQIHNTPSAPIAGPGWATIDFPEDTSLSFWSKHTRHQRWSTMLSCMTFAEHLHTPTPLHRHLNFQNRTQAMWLLTR